MAICSESELRNILMFDFLISANYNVPLPTAQTTDF